MKILSLPSGDQKGVHGVHGPASTPTEEHLVKLKLKRKLQYKGHHMFQYISPQQMDLALSYLRRNNQFYQNITALNTYCHDDLTRDTSLTANPTTTTGSNTNSTHCDLVGSSHNNHQHPNHNNTTPPQLQTILLGKNLLHQPQHLLVLNSTIILTPQVTTQIVAPFP
jgi:hypothetical protein